MKQKSRHEAVVRSADGSFSILSRATPTPNADEILLEPTCVGICGTDLQIARGVRRDRASVLGHEGVARVLDFGAQVAGYDYGQRVVFNPVSPTNQDRILGHSHDGLLQRRFLVGSPELEQGMLIPVPSGVPDLAACFAEPLGAAIYARELAEGDAKPERAMIIGAGPIGLLCSMVEAHAGTTQVLVVHNSSARASWLATRGVVSASGLVPFGPDAPSRILGAFSGCGADIVYVSVPRRSAVSAFGMAIECVRAGGCIDLVGGFPSGAQLPTRPPIDPDVVRRSNVCGVPANGIRFETCSLAGKPVFVTGHRGTSATHLRAALEMLEQNHLETSALISHVLSLDYVPNLFDTLCHSSNVTLHGCPYVKGVVDFTAEHGSLQSFTV